MSVSYKGETLPHFAMRIAKEHISKAVTKCYFPPGKRTFFLTDLEKGLRYFENNYNNFPKSDDMTKGELLGVEYILGACLIALGKDWKPADPKSADQIMKELGF